jgi:sulfite exporter TauE/SafE
MGDSFILGLSSGSACLATCGMVMFPYLMSGSAGTRKIISDLSLFLLTRCIVYFLLANIAWYFGRQFLNDPLVRNIVPGILYVSFSVLLVWYSINESRKPSCPAKLISEINNRRLIPVFLGIINSLGFCPALLLMLTNGATKSSLAQSYLAFLAFFAGSSIWFLPLPLAGKLKKKEVIRKIGILATGLSGIIFMIKGLTNIIGGLIQ